MWLFDARLGFFSAVMHRDDPGTIIVRARRKRDLEALVERIPEPERQQVEIQCTPDFDYEVRVFISRERWAELVAGIARQVDCRSFKDAAADRGTFQGDLLFRVWDTMAEHAEE